jgi:hypothetical protein
MVKVRATELARPVLQGRSLRPPAGAAAFLGSLPAVRFVDTGIGIWHMQSEDAACRRGR